MPAPTRAVAGAAGGFSWLLGPPTTPSSTSRCHSTFSSVNPNEVSHFTALAAEWWEPHGSSRLLHLMNPLRHDLIRSCLQESSPSPSTSTGSSTGTGVPDASITYLDIGCGGGIFAESAARLPSTKHVTAIDPTPSVLNIAKAHARKDPCLAGKLTYQLSSVEQLPVPAEGAGYDVVTLFEVIEHVDNPAAFLDRVRPLVKPGGWLVMSTIARTWISWLTTNLIAEDILRIVPKGTHDWNKYVNEEELRGFLAGKGWDSAKVVGVVYVPGLGWREVKGSEKVGNYFFAVRKV
ncbi:ubiquinone biosynthesis O-methyltransferase [Trichoderma citrinoviride]|uniref:Ubiquinone biosynthesis O-methyltransferase, mitochondrial n=1 Tax=Trichoderma citrinoviride TaxID=58853 RepID=A0A2T4BIH6_9HYPO|nr:ubiquinone biosynthesis O-methyltransferase [Trichoderma citrinoviride]PTB69059.1 ubiquinone biosynthesis O-methyltransferase [Trichoderma citrinoviride]